jgi:hypothetical protein
MMNYGRIVMLRRIPLSRLVLQRWILILLLLAVIPISAHAMPSEVMQGVVWLDQTCDGIRDSSEPPLANLEVYLFAAGADGVVSTPDDQVIDVGGSSPSGSFFFRIGTTDLDYRITVLVRDQPWGLRPGPYHAGDDPTRDNDLTTPLSEDPNYWTSGAFRLDADHTVTGVDIGLCQIPLDQHLYLPVMRRS